MFLTEAKERLGDDFSVNPKVSWKFLTLFVCHLTNQNYKHSKFQIELKTNPETGFPERRTIKFGTNCDLSDERKWKPQIQVDDHDDKRARCKR